MIIHRILTHPRLIAQSRIVAAKFRGKTLFEKIVARAIIRGYTGTHRRSQSLILASSQHVYAYAIVRKQIRVQHKI